MLSSCMNIIYVYVFTDHLYSLCCSCVWDVSQTHDMFKARVYNPGELARFESGTSSKFHPPIPSVLRPKPRPHKLERASGSGTQQGEGDAGARRSNSAEFSTEQTGSKVPK